MSPGRQLGFLWGAAVLVCAAAAPFAQTIARSFPPCPFHWLTGLPCATCGGTRALLALSKFDLSAAVVWNPLVAVAAIVFAAGGLVAFSMAALGRDVRVPNPTLGLRVAIGLALVSNWAFLVAQGR